VSIASIVLIAIIIFVVYIINKRDPTRFSNLVNNIKTRYSTFNDQELPDGNKIEVRKIGFNNPLFEETVSELITRYKYYEIKFFNN
jgi:hypothetical protein